MKTFKLLLAIFFTTYGIYKLYSLEYIEHHYELHLFIAIMFIVIGLLDFYLVATHKNLKNGNK